MISVGKIRWSPFFSGLSQEHIAAITDVAQEISVEAGFSFFREGDELDTFYLVKEGAVDITIGIPDHRQEHKFVDQITDNLNMVDITVSTVGVGEIFGWSAIIQPHEATASARASTSCRVIAVNCEKLRPIFEKDRNFAYLMTLKAAQTVRSRLRDRRIESLAFVSQSRF